MLIGDHTHTHTMVKQVYRSRHTHLRRVKFQLEDRWTLREYIPNSIHDLWAWFLANLIKRARVAYVVQKLVQVCPAVVAVITYIDSCWTGLRKITITSFLVVSYHWQSMITTTVNIHWFQSWSARMCVNLHPTVAWLLFTALFDCSEK